jgi:phenylacetate-coenzyme A ligase PaaK-like adenylate-forming protein
MVWQHFFKAIQEANIDIFFPQGILLHSGGWKKLEAQKVSNQVFKKTCSKLLRVEKVHNFYGMAEQVGSIFVECEHGHLHAPVYADVIVRDLQTLKPIPHGQLGLIQVLSIVPTSYPGHSLLTEDVGRIMGEDDCPCGRKGKYFEVIGRLPKSEVRGCSDTFS